MLLACCWPDRLSKYDASDVVDEKYRTEYGAIDGVKPVFKGAMADRMSAGRIRAGAAAFIVENVERKEGVITMTFSHKTSVLRSFHLVELQQDA